MLERAVKAGVVRGPDPPVMATNGLPFPHWNYRLDGQTITNGIGHLSKLPLFSGDGEKSLRCSLEASLYNAQNGNCASRLCV